MADDRRDTAIFACAVSSVVVVIGGVLISVGGGEVAGTRHPFFSNTWALSGLFVAGIGAVALIASLLLFFARKRPVP